ncbi:hypothetical protein HK19_09870 [Acetobacter persici]|nr:hypothetical protein HK19_09870 [Acetobacter persici]
MVKHSAGRCAGFMRFMVRIPSGTCPPFACVMQQVGRAAFKTDVFCQAGSGAWPVWRTVFL